MTNRSKNNRPARRRKSSRTQDTTTTRRRQSPRPASTSLTAAPAARSSRRKGPQTLRQVRVELEEISQSFLEKAKRGGGRHQTLEDDAVFSTLAGQEHRLPYLVSSDVKARKKAARLVHKAYRNIRATRPATHFWHVTILHSEWLTSDENTEIRLRQMFQKAAPFLASLTGNYLAVAELQAFANIKHVAGGKLLSLHIHAIVWGERAFDVQAALAAWTPHFRAIDPAVPSIQIDPVGGRPKDLAKLAFYPLKAAYRCKTRFVHSVTGKANLHESEKGDRYIRYHRLFEILSHINLRKLFHGGGEGVDILAAIGKKMRSWARRKGDAAAISPDRIPVYWSTYRSSRPGQRRFHPPRIDVS